MIGLTPSFPHLQLWPLSADDRQLYCELDGDPRVMRYVTAPLSSFAANRSFDTALARVHGATPLQWLWRASDR